MVIHYHIHLTRTWLYKKKKSDISQPNYSYYYLGGFTEHMISHNQALYLYWLHKIRGSSRSSPHIIGFAKNMIFHDQTILIIILVASQNMQHTFLHKIGPFSPQN